jgi:dTDP-4-dehydrorhamnose reductase
MKILITGAAGMLGVAVVGALKRRDCEILATVRPGHPGVEIPMDIGEWESVRQVIGRHQPSLVLHLAAETDVDRCEREPDHAYATNAFATENVARACRENGAEMVYISTANVFDGEKIEPYTEYDAPGSLNAYGKSKRAGERVVEQMLDAYYIFRAGWMVGGWEIDKKFVYKMVQLCRTENELKVVNDKIGSPTFTGDFADVMLAAIETRRYGLYHLANQGCASRWEIACEIVRLLGKDGQIEVTPVSSAEFPLPAPRPRSEMLRNFKLELLGLDGMPHWKDSLREYIEQNRDKA